MPLNLIVASRVWALSILLSTQPLIPAPAVLLTRAASSWATRLNAGSLAIFFAVSTVDLLSSRTAFVQSGARFGVVVLPCSVSVPIVMPPGSALASIWSSTGFCPPPEQEDQFFQNPIVSARPPGGGVLSTVKVFFSPGATVKLTHRVL